MADRLAPNPLLRMLLRKRRPPLSKFTKLALAHPATMGAARRADLFNHVRTFCLFLGYSRSGHSLPAALLDAHPRIVMAHELGVLRYARARLGRSRLYELLLQNTRIRGHSAGRGGGYTYDVDRGWQGRFDRIEVIGDKHGEFTAHYLARMPGSLDRLRRVVGVPIRFIHMVRNPYDNIASRSIRRAERYGGEPDLSAAIEAHRTTCRAVTEVLNRLDADDVFQLRHEAFVADPSAQLAALCHWLGVEAEPAYLSACAANVKASPHPSRHRMTWTAGQKAQVQQMIDDYPFLDGYEFDES